MNLMRDMLCGWRARRLVTTAYMVLGAALSLLIGVGLHLLETSAHEAQNLMANWPDDACTLLLPPDPPAGLTRNLLNRLPANRWFAFESDRQTVWISGTLPRNFFQGTGNTLPPEVIQRGEAAVLLAHSAGKDTPPGSIYLWEDRAYRVYGVGSLQLPAERIIPSASRSSAAWTPQEIRVQLPAAQLRPLLQEFSIGTFIQLLDHGEQREQAMRGFRKLRRHLTGIGLAGAFTAALLFQALYQAEIRERKSEFALRRSLGALPSSIRNQLLLETLLTFALPCLLGFLPFLGKVATSTLTAAYGLTLFWLLLCAGLPALQAAGLSPGEALKGE